MLRDDGSCVGGGARFGRNGQENRSRRRQYIIVRPAPAPPPPLRFLNLPPLLMLIYYNAKVSYLNAKGIYAYSSRLECKPVGTGGSGCRGTCNRPRRFFLQNALYYNLPSPLDFLIFLRPYVGISTHELSTFS
jgi:hypothetical protein